MVWALRELRVASTAVSFELGLLCRRMKTLRGLGDLDRALQTEVDTWEAKLVGSLMRSGSVAESQAEINAALFEVDAVLAPNTRTYAACSRIAVFGCLIAVAWLFMVGEGLSTVVLDVFAIGAAGVFTTVAAGKEARRLVRLRRVELDEWAGELMRARWPDSDCQP